jgi:signal transduction histidine kinase
MIGHCVPDGLADLTASRRRLAAALHDGARPPAIGEDAVERLLLAYEELVSNALRHGRRPVEVTVTGTDTSWLLEVSDAAAEQPPSPAIGRDPARGGLGLYLVAQLSDAHGWTTGGQRKTVWARIDHTHTEIRTTARQGRAQPPLPRGPDH